jgi:large subunit ribosomal protein L10
MRAAPTARKAAEVAELKDLVQRSVVAISAQYRGLRVADMSALRRQMRGSGVEVRVVKNTLLRIAAHEAGKPQVAELALGPTAVIFGYDDIARAAKTVQDYVRTLRGSPLTIQGAWIEGQLLLGPESLADLASIPSRDQLLANFMGGLRSPIQTFAGLLSGTIQQFAGLIDARATQLEGAA